MAVAPPLTDSMQGAKVTVLGAGLSGLAAARLLLLAGATVTIADDYKSAHDIGADLGTDGVTIRSGDLDDGLPAADLLVLSPGIADSHPVVRECLATGAEVISELALASRYTAAPILAVTGSNGKSTTATMLHQMLAGGGFRSFLGGNIGAPFSATVLEERRLQPARPVHVLEVSSFQAEHLGSLEAQVVLFLNLSPDHLDRYPDMETYGRAKLRLADHVAERGWIVYNRQDSYFSSRLEEHAQAVPFGPEPAAGSRFAVRKGAIVAGRKRLLPLAELALPGPHNVSNFLAAATAASLMEIKTPAISQVLKSFAGLPHRLELLGTLNTVPYYNDSKATNIASAKVALESFDGPVILILGGSDKGADYSELLPAMTGKVRQVVTYGEVGLRMAELFQGVIPLHFEQLFEAAVNRARDAAKAGDTVLLSPACASYDQFAGFEQRGAAFRQIVEAYQRQVNHA